MNDVGRINMTITFEDGSKHEFIRGTSYLEMSKTFNMKGKALAVLVNNRIASLSEKPIYDETIEFLDYTKPMGNRIYCSGLRMCFEYAVKISFPDIKVKYAYSIPKGIVAELISPKYLTNDDINVIRKNMNDVVKSDSIIEKLVMKSHDVITYYSEFKNKVKAENIKNITDPMVYLYRLNNIINYYYSEMPYSTGAIDKYEIKYLGKNLVVINYPSEYGDNEIPDYVNYSGIINSYKKGQEWLECMNVPYINNVNKEIVNGKASNFVRSCELNFNIGINETAKKIAESGNIKCVMISGPSSSGKTTVTKRLANYFEIYGLKPVVISIDDYFKERDETPLGKDGKPDFECLEAIDTDMLKEDVVKLFNGEEVMLPVFDFITGKKQKAKKVKLEDNGIILFEGLHGINDRLMPFIPDTIKYKIYVSPFIPLCLDEHNYISCNDLRLLRRIVRDFRTRGCSVESTIKHWDKVRMGEENNILPFIQTADTIIDTSLPYEVGVLKTYVVPLLYSIDNNSKYYAEARRLLSFLKQFFAITSEYVPKDSIIREFIGGGTND